jgi:hypothetical protein
LTGTDVDDNGGDASKVAVSYAMDNGLTLKASVEDESIGRQVAKTSQHSAFHMQWTL